MLYIIELANASAHDHDHLWLVYDKTWNLHEANILQDEAKRKHPTRRVRIRQHRERVDIFG